MELLLLGIAAMFCSPLLDKKEEKKEEKKDSGDRVIVVVIDPDGKPKADK